MATRPTTSGSGGAMVEAGEAVTTTRPAVLAAASAAGAQMTEWIVGRLGMTATPLGMTATPLGTTSTPPRTTTRTPPSITVRTSAASRWPSRGWRGTTMGPGAFLGSTGGATRRATSHRTVVAALGAAAARVCTGRRLHGLVPPPTTMIRRPRLPTCAAPHPRRTSEGRCPLGHGRMMNLAGKTSRAALPRRAAGAVQRLGPVVARLQEASAAAVAFSSSWARRPTRLRRTARSHAGEAAGGGRAALVRLPGAGTGVQVRSGGPAPAPAPALAPTPAGQFGAAAGLRASNCSSTTRPTTISRGSRVVDPARAYVRRRSERVVRARAHATGCVGQTERRERP